MININKSKRNTFCRIIVLLVVSIFLSQSFILPSVSIAQNNSAQFLNMPAPGTMLNPSPAYVPPLIKAITIDPNDALQFDFIIDSGNATLTEEELKQETDKLVKYFLAALTVPAEELWVNLSPYEKDRTIPIGLGYTEMGRDLLVQDYFLKQLTATLMYPENNLGKEFWTRVKQKAQEVYGTTDIPMNTFNKIWIVPEDAVVLEQENNVIVIQSHLKVMLEEDYLALKQTLGNENFGTENMEETQAKEMNTLTHDIVYDLLIPEIEKEVNEGKNFANLRQIYNSMILATWYKQSLKQSFLTQVYADKNKVIGVDVDDPYIKESIFNKYLEAFKEGVYNYSKNEFDLESMTLVSKRYYSGGIEAGRIKDIVKQRGMRNPNMSTRRYIAQLSAQDAAMVTSGLKPTGQIHRMSARFENKGMTFNPGHNLARMATRILENPAAFRRFAPRVLSQFNMPERDRVAIVKALENGSRKSLGFFKSDAAMLNNLATSVSAPTVQRMKEERILPKLARGLRDYHANDPKLSRIVVADIPDRAMVTTLNQVLTDQGVREPQRAAETLVQLKNGSPKSFFSAQTLDAALLSRKIDGDTVARMTSPDTIKRMTAAVSQQAPAQLASASIPVRAAHDGPEAFAADVDRAIINVSPDDQKRAELTRVFVDMAEKSRAEFSTPQRLDAALLARGVEPQIAQRATSPEVLQKITQAGNERDVYNDSLGLIPVRAAANPEFGKAVKVVLANNGLDEDTQDVAVRGVMNLAKVSPETFDSEDALVKGLKAQRIPESTIGTLKEKGIFQQLASLGQQPSPGLDKGTKGGIDFNTALLNLSVQKEGAGVQLAVNTTAMDILNLGGFEPVITNVGPASSLEQELGLDK